MYQHDYDYWRPPNDDLEQARMTDDLKSALVFFLLLIVALLVLLYSPKEQTPTGISVWPPGTPLRVEARRDFSLLGGPLKDGQCGKVNGVPISTYKHTNGNKGAKPEYEKMYQNRSYECSKADHDIYARYIAPDGTVFDVLSHDSSKTAEGAFGETIPSPMGGTKSAAYGKLQGDTSYSLDLPSGAFRTEGIIYRHRYLKPGQYFINVHLESADSYLPKKDVLVGAFVVLFEGTPDEVVLFNGQLPLNIRDKESREQTVVSFRVNEQGQLIEDSVDYDTQVFIAESGAY